MKRRIFFILFILVLLISAATIYLSKVYLPPRIKSWVIQVLEKQTQKRVRLDSIHLSLFKGLVLRNLNISDDQRTIFSLKEASCVFFILPIFTKSLIIPRLKLKSPVIFLERRKDNTFNLQDLFPKTKIPFGEEKKFTPSPVKPRSLERGAGFAISISRVSIFDAAIHFQDSTLVKPFTKDIENLDADLYLSLPASVKFNFNSDIKTLPVINLNAKGKFIIPSQQFSAAISIQNLSPKEFSVYYQNFGLEVAKGLIDAQIKLQVKDNIWYVELEAQNENLLISKNGIQALLNAQVDSSLQYNLKEKELKFSGAAAVSDSRVLGLQFVGDIDDIDGKISFNNSGVSSDRLNATIFGIPLQAKLSLADFNNPLLDADINSTLNLASLPGLLKDKFKFEFPGSIRGQGNLFLEIQKSLVSAEVFKIKGYLDTLDAAVKLEKLDSPIEDISGRLGFTQGDLKWSDLNFSYLGTNYKTAGALTNFVAPRVQLGLSSNELSLESRFVIDNKIIDLSKLSGRYLNSEFSFAGSVNTQEPPKLEVDLGGGLDIELEEIQQPLEKFKGQLEKINPKGRVHARFSLSGNINELKTCAVQAKFSGSPVSFYGLNSEEFFLDYNQENGLADIPQMRLSLYGGTLMASAKMNLNSENLPYIIAADMQNIEIEKLKVDTAAKDKDISGIIQAHLELKGYYHDLSKLIGSGKIDITKGKLWQLNLFRGLGSLIFAREFAHLIFHEGRCDFLVKDKYISTENLRLRSNIIDLFGAVKVGFDSSLDARLNVEILDEVMPLSNTFKDITSAIAGKLGVIKISGTLKEPRYKFEPVVVDIIKGLKDLIFGNL